MEDDLEYSITFPSPDVSNDEFESALHSNGKETVVILLGWAGSSDKHLAKYSAIYERRRCITIRYTLSMELLMFTPHKVRTLAERVIELVADLALDDNPIILHLFSNGGGAVYREIAAILHETSPPRLRVVGCVLDSSPGDSTSAFGVRAGVRAAYAGVDATGTLTRCLYACAALVLLLLVQLAGFLARLVGAAPPARTTYYDAMKNDASRWPQLFLYSRADELIDHRAVTAVVERRRELGVPVRAVCWEDSPHVRHLVAHREAYVNAVYQFTQACLSDDDEAHQSAAR
ncbi:PREDICTED: transmembrane protein 53-like [Priapulus caudatus]|uniref:Transmembrane protein 53-like n=1 Tax=Priapulus caudatus TaxID=37621 RepID=A0ABM1DZ53_PRICU|nr:PREDICTED: transmembrane protein 53-like [Priapulus caudatus]XP_014665226.1 PREDICTED: transmembrane protein 53-like [Priapulus caudatus]